MLGRLLRRYLMPYWPFLIGVLVFQFLQSIASLALPSINADIINNGVARADTAYIWSTGGIMLLVSLGQILCAVAATGFAAAAAMRMGRDIRAAIFDRVSDFSERELSEFGPGSLITRNTNDVQQVQMLVMTGATMLVTAPMLALGGIIMTLRQEAGMSWIIAVSVPVLLVAMTLIALRMLPLFVASQKRLDAVNRVLREQLTGVRVVRAFVREGIERDRFDAANRQLTDVGRRVGELFALLFPLAMFIMHATIIGIVWFGGIEVDRGAIQLGTIFALLSYSMLILMGVLLSMMMIVLGPRASVSAGRIGEVLQASSSLRVPEDPVTSFPEPGELRFRDVTFRYPGAAQAVLDGVSFHAGWGDMIAIVGSTGSGKTTLINLIARLLDVSSGEVLLAGVDVRQAEPEAMWRRIGMVPQRPFLFSGTVASNLRFGCEDASDDELWRALEIAQARDFVEAMDGGLEARISQGGTNVSGGQRQRLAIARAIVRRPEFLLFDDSFSALDLATDARLRRALWRSLPESTKIVVAQRISTIQDADRILVLEDGRITGDGTHEELLEGCETYREIVASQLGAQEIA